MEKLTELIDSGAESYTVYLQRASVYYSTDNYNKCVEDCKKVLSLEEKCQQAYILLCSCYKKQGLVK